MVSVYTDSNGEIKVSLLIIKCRFSGVYEEMLRLTLNIESYNSKKASSFELALHERLTLRRS